MHRGNKCSFLFISILSTALLFHFSRHQVDTAPIIPILTALATSAAGIFQIQVDTLHIAKYLRESANCKKNRGAFVRDLLYTAFYRSSQTHNVIVFNLGEEHRQRLYGVLFYGSVAYTDGTRFGVWVFESGVFENKGARGWHNWGMIGTFKKSNGGETIFFQRRHKIPSSGSTSNTTTTPMLTTSLTSSSKAVQPADFLLGFNETSTLLIESADITKNFIGEKDEKPEKEIGNENDNSPIRVELNVSMKPTKEKSSTDGGENDDADKSTSSKKPKSANSIMKKRTSKQSE